MVKTYSKMVPLDSKAVDFSLLDVISMDNIHFRQNDSSKATVLMFICNHCPYVKHINHELVNIANDYQSEGIRFIAINSNDVENYPEDSPEKMREMAIQHAFPFPYLFDETQEIAKAYQAMCTPDFFVYDANARLVYRGQLDDARPGNDFPVNGKNMRLVLDSILNNQVFAGEQIPSMGCNIKWKSL